MSRKKHWHVTVVPVDADGYVLPGYELDKYYTWTDAEPAHEGPCPWKNGEILSPSLACDIAGEDPAELEEISEQWKVVVAWGSDE